MRRAGAEGLEAWRDGVDGPWDRAAAAHLLRRAGFGPRPGDVERALERGFEATLEELLSGAGGDDEVTAGVEHVLATSDVELLQAWWMALILGAGVPLVERVALMWHDHFATSAVKVRDVRMMHRQNVLFRERGLGDFRRLLHSVAKDPAMLVWLDGNENKRGQANENFAREVMELFALGIGNYGEGDVREAARAFTGWGTSGRSFVFRPEYHDPGVKRVLGTRGNLSGEQVIDVILAHPACARHVARRLLTELVEPSPTRELVEALAAELVAGDWSIARAIEILLRSRRFHDAEVLRSRIAGPVELVAGSARALDAQVPPGEAARVAGRMGQLLFAPPSVKGWDGGRAWIDAGTWLARHNGLVALATAGDEGPLRVDLHARFGEPERSDQVPARVEAGLLHGPASPGLNATLERAARESDSVEQALVRVTALVLVAPEYHLS